MDSMIGQGLAKFTERGEKCKERCKTAWGRALYKQWIHDLLHHLFSVLQPELFFRLYEPLGVKYANMTQSVLVIFLNLVLILVTDK